MRMRIATLLLLTCVSVGAQYLAHRRQAFQPAASSFPAGLLAYWKGDESSGNMADSIGSLTLVNNSSVAFGAGIINNAPQFVASSTDSFSVADSSITSFGAGVYKSITFWMRSSVFNDNNFRRVMGKVNAVNEWRFYITGSENIEWVVWNASGTPSVVTSAETLANNTTYFVAAGYDGANLWISINGGAKATAAFTADIRDSTSAFYIGDAGDGVYFDGGWIDEIGIWDHSLSDTDIDTIYNGGTGLQP